MDNVFKALALAVGLIITACLIGYGVTIQDKSKTTFNAGATQLDSSLAAFNDMDKQLYAGSTRSGNEVIQCIQKYAESDGIYVIVMTKAGGANVYDWTLTSVAGNAAAAAGATDPYAAISLEASRCSGFPAKDAKGRALFFPTEDTTVQAPTGTFPVSFASNFNASKATQDAGATQGKYMISAATQMTETGAYDATLNTQDYGYISPSASFTSSIQVNQNNEVKFITFVQK